MPIDLRHHVRHKHLDHLDLCQVLPPGVSPVMHHDAPPRDSTEGQAEDLQAWRERVAADYMARRVEALAHHHGES